MTTLCRDYRPADPPVLVAWPTNTVSLEDKFHNAVLSAKFQKIKELVARGNHMLGEVKVVSVHV